MHREIMAAAIQPDAILNTALIDMYGRCGSPEDAQRVFDGMMPQPPDQIAWGALIGAYSHSEECGRVMELFDRMELQGIQPSTPTFIGALAACAKRQTINWGRQLHQRAIKLGLIPHPRLENALINMSWHRIEHQLQHLAEWLRYAWEGKGDAGPFAATAE